MPWLSIIMWFLTYFLSTKSGVSSGKAALLATGAAAGTYYLADPSNTENVLGVTLGEEKSVPGSFSESSPSTNTASQLGTLGSQIVSETGKTLTSWGPLGTMGVIGAGAGVLTGNTNWLLLGGLALGAVVLLK